MIVTATGQIWDIKRVEAAVRDLELKPSRNEALWAERRDAIGCRAFVRVYFGFGGRYKVQEARSPERLVTSWFGLVRVPWYR